MTDGNDFDEAAEKKLREVPDWMERDIEEMARLVSYQWGGKWVTGLKDEAAAKKLKKELEVLREEEKTLEARVILTNRGIARAEGYIFENVQALMQAAYPGKEIIEKEGKFYLSEVSEATKMIVPVHYKCPDCGVVSGEKSYKNVAARGQDSGYVTYYSCRICDKTLGSDRSMLAQGI